MALNFDRSLEVTYRVVDEVLPGIRRVVAENPGPYTFKGTATFIIGRGDVAIIDPGPADVAHIEAILGALRGERVTHQLITHTHPDHSPGARLIKERTGAPTYAFGPHPDVVDNEPEEAELDDDRSKEGTSKDSTEATSEEAKAKGTPKDSDAEKSSEEKSDVDFVPDVFVEDGHVIEGSGWSVEGLHTPGHISNHLCFAFGPTLFTGDHVMGWSTSVISPPGGNLDDYMASLAKLLPRRETVYVPTHGSPITNAPEFVQGLIEHRRDRTNQIRRELADGPRTVRELVTALYLGLDPRLVKAAGRSVLAHLQSLERAGDVRREVTAVTETTVTTRWLPST